VISVSVWLAESVCRGGGHQRSWLPASRSDEWHNESSADIFRAEGGSHMTTTATTPIDAVSREPGPDPAGTVSDAHVDLAPVWALIKRLPAYMRLSANLARDPRVPKTAKASLALGGIYVVSPVDLIPGIIPVAGQLDDLYVLLT